jgi:PAS domain S-box-containing protein
MSHAQCARQHDSVAAVPQAREPNLTTQAGLEPAGARADKRRLDALHRLLIDRVTDYAIFALDPEGYVQSWNAGAERLKGYAAQEIIGRHLSVFYTAEDRAADRPARNLRVAAAAGRVEDEGWRVRKDGTLFWANVLITAVRSDSGELLGFAKVTRDLTERRRAEQELRESEERLRLMVASVKDYAIFMLDPTGRVTTWNSGAERIKGYTAEQIIGKHFSIFYPADEAATKPAHELAVALSAGRYEEEGWRVRRDGSRFMASVVITPVRTADGVLAGFAKVTRDLTERRAAQERAIVAARRLAAEEASRAAAEARAKELHTLAEQLRIQGAELARQSSVAEKANRVKSEFLAAMSHELRTPLNAIGGYAQLMEMGIDGEVTDAQRDHLERIRHSQHHLLGIINDILNFSRIEAGQLEYDIAAISLCEAMVSGAAMIEPQAQESGIVVMKGACSPEVVAMADRGKVGQILLNLLSNALKFTLPGGEIELRAGTRADTAWISVRDSGVGISPENLAMIFEPFMQIGRSLASPKEGTGLGLAISRDLARAMKGDLTAESEEGVGSTFTLTLPRGE